MKDFSSFINATLIIGAVQGIVLGTMLLFRKKNNILAGKIMSVILYLFSISIMLHVLSHSGALPFYDFHKVLIGIIYISVAPLIYFYIRTLTAFGFSFGKKELLHFIPFVFSLAVIPLFLINPYNYEILKEIILVFSFAVVAFYIVYSNLLLYSFGKVIKNNFSDIEKKNLIWLRIFIFCFSLFWAFGGISDLLFKTISWDFVWLGCSIIIFLTGYFGFNQPEIFSDREFINAEKTGKTSIKYEKSYLSKEIKEKYLKNLENVMNNEKVFLENDMNLSLLSKKCGIPIHNLSQILNEDIGLSFYDYINSHRIEESKKILLNPEYSNTNIAAIGFEVGFNSLSAFNSAFKKFTKTTPSRFRNAKKETEIC